MKSQRRTPKAHRARYVHGEESSTSKRYTRGKTVGYKWRLRGPVRPVTTSRVEPDREADDWETR